jgi:hypothetical protein
VLAYPSHFAVFQLEKCLIGLYRETQLISLTQEITNHLHYGIQNYLLILDFSKAFDKVSHKKLLFKLGNYGIRDTTIKWIGSFLNNRMQQAVLDWESSS